jgi:hypothetical protein
MLLLSVSFGQPAHLSIPSAVFGTPEFAGGNQYPLQSRRSPLSYRLFARNQGFDGSMPILYASYSL